jgi:hypothetical protein
MKTESGRTPSFLGTLRAQALNLASKSHPECDPVLSAILIGFGWVLTIGYLAIHLLAWRPLESREFLAYAFSGLGLPLLALYVAKKRRPFLHRFFGVIVCTHLAGCLLLCASTFAEKLLHKLPQSSVWALALTLPIAWLTHEIGWRIGVFLQNNDEKSLCWFLFSWLCLAAALLANSPGLWLQFHLGLSYVAFGLMVWWVKRVWLQPSPRPSGLLALRLTDAFWIVCLVAFSLGAGFDVGEVVMGNFSFYAGPMELVKSGRPLLNEVPSQYGFLSILFPAWLPITSAWTSLQVAYGSMLFLQALLSFSIFRALNSSFWSRNFAGLLALLSTFLIPGARTGLAGVWEYPSTGAYRFFWVTALAACLLVPLRRTWIQLLLVSLLVTIGSMWSAESAVYVVCTFSFVTLVEALLITHRREWSAQGHSWRTRLLVPVATLLCSVGLVLVAYAYRYGVAADWTAFFEYALAYTSGFGSIPIAPWGAVNLLILFLAVSASVAMQGLNKSCAEAAAYFAPFAVVLATGSYFVSRSNDSNALNLCACWLPLLCLLWVRTKADGQWIAARACATLAAPVVIMMGAIALPLFPKALLNLKAPPPLALEERVLLARPSVTDPLLPRVLDLIGNSPMSVLIDLDGVFPSLSFRYAHFTPWLPAYPWQEFNILPVERQAVYLERFLKRNKAPRAFLLKDSRQIYPAVDQTLPLHYQRVAVTDLGRGYFLEEYRSVEGDSGSVLE